MKTGRLIKFQRPQAEVQAYLYQEQGRFHAAVFVLAPGAAGQRESPVYNVIASSQSQALDEVRAWVDRFYPARPASEKSRGTRS